MNSLMILNGDFRKSVQFWNIIRNKNFYLAGIEEMTRHKIHQGSNEEIFQLYTNKLFNYIGRVRFVQNVIMIGGLSNLPIKDNIWHFSPIQLLYNRLFCHVININENDNITAKFVEDKIENSFDKIPKEKKFEWILDPKFQNYTGSLFPKILFVGDTHNHDHNLYELPFHSGINSSRWIHVSLSNAGFNLDEIGMMNANDDNSEKIFSRVYNEDCKVIALGTSAAKWLKGKVNDFSHLPHPSWARRFNSNSPDDYVEKLLQAIGQSVP